MSNRKEKTNQSPFARLRVAAKSPLVYWQRPREKTLAPPPVRGGCVIVGPVASGKTALLLSLTQCGVWKSHSYANRYDVTIAGKNQDFQRYEKDLQSTIFHNGLITAATKLEDFFRLEFTLHTPSCAPALEARHRSKKISTIRTLSSRFFPRAPGVGHHNSETRFTTFDGSGSLLSYSWKQADVQEENATLGGQSPDHEKGLLESLRTLRENLTSCESVILCLPIDGSVPDNELNALNERIFELREHPNIRRLLVCFTKYEKWGLRYGRDAYRRMATRREAGRLMSIALMGEAEYIRSALNSFRHGWGKQVWCVPVSAYGFVPGNGAPNCDLSDVHLPLLTREPQREKERSDEKPYLQTRGKRNWRPFLTLDPFAFIATGEWKGTLIHRFDEL
jgi:hypothetical protein